MIQCRACGAKNPLNTLFCEECGGNLTEQQKTETAGSERLSAERGRPPALHLVILSSGRTVDIPPGHDAFIGRRDTAHGIAPEVDLTDDGGLEGGVSRHHAQISSHEGQVYLQDLGSINGTLLNREPLSPYLPRPLRHGDELRLGNVPIRVEFH